MIPNHSSKTARDQRSPSKPATTTTASRTKPVPVPYPINTTTSTSTTTINSSINNTVFNNNRTVQPRLITVIQPPPLTSPGTPDKFKRNQLRKLLEQLLKMVITPDNLPVIITIHFKTIINELMKIKMDSKERCDCFQFLKNQINSSDFEEYHFVKEVIIPNLMIAFGVGTQQAMFNNSSTQNMPTNMPTRVPEEKIDLKPIRPLPVETPQKQLRLIELAPKISSAGEPYFALEFDDNSITTRLFYDIIKTSKKFFTKMNINIVYEKRKNGFSTLDFTSLGLTLSSHKQLFSSAHTTFMKLKGIRNEWAHFVNLNKIPPKIISACFSYIRAIFKQYQNITQQNSDAHQYMQRRIDLLDMLERDYIFSESKIKTISTIAAQFCKDSEKKKQSALRVIQLLSESVGSSQHDEKQLDGLYNEILLNILPRSPYLLKEMQQLNAKTTSRKDIVFTLLENEFQMKIKLDEQYVKSVDGMSLSDQRFVSKSVFFKSIVMQLKNTTDHRKVLFERSYHYYILQKCLKSLKEHNFEEGIIQQFKEHMDINTPKETYESVMKEIDTQAELFNNIWIAMAMAFGSCCALEIPDAIKYLCWALTEMTMTTNIHFPLVIKPYIDLALKCLYRLNLVVIQNNYEMGLDMLKVIVNVCLASLLKFQHLSPELGNLFNVTKVHILNNCSHLLQQLTPQEASILQVSPEQLKKELLIPVTLIFSPLSKNDRANIFVEGCSNYALYQDILNDEEGEQDM